MIQIELSHGNLKNEWLTTPIFFLEREKNASKLIKITNEKCNGNITIIQNKSK